MLLTIKQSLYAIELPKILASQFANLARRSSVLGNTKKTNSHSVHDHGSSTSSSGNKIIK